MMDGSQADLDSLSSTLSHGRILQQKALLRFLYRDFYGEFRKTMPSLPKGKIVELGSGAGFLKEIIPRVVTSDVVKLPNCDMRFSAEKMPFKNSSIGAFFGLDVLHHIKDIKKALKEINRCLKPGGKAVMIEPYNSIWGRFVFQNFHHEEFDPKAGWEIKKTGRMSGANGALPWIIFVRDRNIFEKKFPNLKIVKFEPHTPFAYLASGGFKVRQLLPSASYSIIRFVEKTLSPLNNYLGMFATLELEKVSK